MGTERKRAVSDIILAGKLQREDSDAFLDDRRHYELAQLLDSERAERARDVHELFQALHSESDERQRVVKVVEELSNALQSESAERTSDKQKVFEVLQSECNARANDVRQLAKSLQAECDARAREVKQLAGLIQKDREAVHALCESTFAAAAGEADGALPQVGYQGMLSDEGEGIPAPPSRPPPGLAQQVDREKFSLSPPRLRSCEKLLELRAELLEAEANPMRVSVPRSLEVPVPKSLEVLGLRSDHC